MKNKKQSTNTPEASGAPGTNKGGRPSKLKLHVLTAFRELLEEEEDIALACTDKELFFLLNLRLSEADRVCYRTFQRYKAKAMGAFDAETEPLYKELFRLFYEALIRQKRRLVRLIEQGGAHWQRFKWILERKFKEWHTAFATAEEAREEIPWEKPVTMIVPIVPREQLDKEYALDSPLITLEEWHRKWGEDQLERPIDLDE